MRCKVIIYWKLAAELEATVRSSYLILLIRTHWLDFIAFSVIYCTRYQHASTLCIVRFATKIKVLNTSKGWSYQKSALLVEYISFCWRRNSSALAFWSPLFERGVGVWTWSFPRSSSTHLYAEGALPSRKSIGLCWIWVLSCLISSSYFEITPST